MAFERDPHGVLGLAPGASPAEVKRAYRRLAKAFHPDAAGPDAMPRFLAIQAAYERLTGESVSGPPVRGRGPGPRPEAWRADADRPSATREAWRARGTRRGGQAPGSAGSGAPDGDGRGTTPGRGTPPGPDAAPRSSGRRGRRGDALHDRATPGSTSYDGADQEPFDPEWSGASWYGQTSGTYWTINPKEYADPRKHGPEYQARARRMAGGPAADEDSPAAEQDATVADPPEPEATAPDPAPRASAPGPRPRTTFRPKAEAGGSRPGRASQTGSSGTSAQWSRAPGERPPPARDAPPPRPNAGERAPAGAALSDDPFALLPIPPGPGARLAIALLGWPPIGMGIAWFAGELSGCGRFSALCVGGIEAFAVGTWVAQALVIAILLLLPAVATISAFGTIAMLGAAVPAAVLLSISGGAREPAAAAAVLGAFLAAGYLGGVLFAIVRRSRTIRA